MSKVQNLMAMVAADPDRAEQLWAVMARENESRVVDSAVALHRLVAPYLVGQEREHLVAVVTDGRYRLIEVEVLSVGSDAITVVESRVIFRWALTRSRMARALFLAHNHPSGDPTPSREDIAVTEAVARAGATVGVNLLDHLVVCDDRYTSLAGLGHVPAATRPASWTS